MNILPGMGLPYTGERQIASGLGNQYYYEMPEMGTGVGFRTFKMATRAILYKMAARLTTFEMKK